MSVDMTDTEGPKDAKALKAERLTRGLARSELDRERAAERRAAPSVRTRSPLWWVSKAAGSPGGNAYKRDREMARRRRQMGGAA